MTPRIPLSRCRRCVHFNGHACPLVDLDPCAFKTKRRTDWSWRIIAILLGAIIAAAILALCTAKPEPTAEAVPHHSAVQLLRQQHSDDLTDWQMLQLAIIYTESRFDPDALGSSQDAGLYQMTPVYVAEVNRVAGTDYAHADAFDPDKAVAMFAALQQHYNPTRDKDLALRYHHRGENYRRAVLNNLEIIRRYEAARKAVTK